MYEKRFKNQYMQVEKHLLGYEICLDCKRILSLHLPYAGRKFYGLNGHHWDDVVKKCKHRPIRTYFYQNKLFKSTWRNTYAYR